MRRTKITQNKNFLKILRKICYINKTSDFTEFFSITLFLGTTLTYMCNFFSSCVLPVIGHPRQQQ